VTSFLSDMLAHPLVRGSSLDDPRTTGLRTRIVEGKGFLGQTHVAVRFLVLDSDPQGDGAILEVA